MIWLHGSGSEQSRVGAPTCIRCVGTADHWTQLPLTTVGSIVVVNFEGCMERAVASEPHTTHLLRMHGVLVYGYVGTGYGGVGYKTMLRRTLNYQRNLGISGVFFDHVPGARKELAPYARLALRLHTAGLRVAINPEQNDLPADLAGSFDEIVLLESG